MRAESISVLMVEADAANARHMVEALEAGNPGAFRVKHVTGPAEAEAWLGGGMPEVIVLGLPLPANGGTEAIKQMREIAPGVPLVVVMDRADEEATIEALRGGVQECLVKGALAGTAARALRHAIERGRAEKTLLARGMLEAAEALGQRTGDIGHNLNNLLTVISGYSELLLEKVGPADRMHGPLTRIRDASAQAGVLSRQLLAISPAAEETAAPGAAKVERRGQETILLVEDDLTLRGIAREALEGEGYTVLAAGDGAEAMRMLEGHGGGVDLLATDVVMPTMGGRELAAAMRGRHPKMGVLYMSGYGDDELMGHGVLPAGAAFLQKPYTLGSLLGKVRQTLDQARG